MQFNFLCLKVFEPSHQAIIAYNNLIHLKFILPKRLFTLDTTIGNKTVKILYGISMYHLTYKFTQQNKIFNTEEKILILVRGVSDLN